MPELTWETQKPKKKLYIYISFCRTIIKFMAGQKRVVKECKQMHKEGRDRNVIPRAKDGANNCTQRDDDLWLFLFSQRPLRSRFHEFQPKQPNWFVTTTWFGKLRQFFAPELPPCLASRFLQIANTQILQWWAQKKTFHKLDQPCCTATGFILGLYTWGKEVPIPGILCFRNNFSCYYSGCLQCRRPRRKTIG